MKIRPWTIILTMLAGWINQHQQDVIEYLKTENAILKEKIGKKRIILSDEQRRKLAVLAKRIGRNGLNEICGIFSPETLLKWHRMLIARKYDGSQSPRIGRPRISEELRNVIIKMAKKNRGWGYTRIQGVLQYLGFKVCHSTIANILKKEGLEPQPDRQKKTTWAEFIRSHWQSLAAIDFFTAEVYTLKGLTRYMVLVAIDYSTRKVEIAGIIEQAHGTWMQQMARNLTDPFSGFLKNKRYVIRDRDPLYTDAFLKILKAGGIEAIKSMPMAPNFSPYIERFIRSIKSECLEKMLIFGEAHLRYIVQNYIEHYHFERPHQSLNNNIIDPPPKGQGEIVCHERLGGLLKFYKRAA